MNLYLWINIFTLGTLFLSFDKKVAFYKYFGALALAIMCVMIVFIPWDIYFTNHHYWGFNPTYLVGTEFMNLPIEEWMFFISVPFACTFIHFVLKAYFKNPLAEKFTFQVAIILSIVLITLGLLNQDQPYTFWSLILCGISLISISYIDKKFIHQFLFTYLICLIPFFIVNSVLTGSFTESPIVTYNDSCFSRIRIGTIPLEDLFYNMLLLLLSTYFTEIFKNYKREKI